MLSFDTALTSALANANTTAFWVLKLYYNDESAFIGISDKHRQDGTDIYYGIVANWGVYRQSLDFFNFTTTIGNMGVTLVNSENSIKGGRFSDLLATNNFVNRKWELFLNANNTSTLDTAARMIASGVISGDINYDSNNVTLTLFDNTSKYHKRVPTNTVVASTYTNAPANNIGKPIPMAYGDSHEKGDIGTIPTSHFDRFYNFYKGAFPAIITDKWDVQEEGSEALADSQAIHTLDNENIYIYKNGYYPTLTGTIDVGGNPEIEYRGSAASVFVPLSLSNIASESTTGSASVADEENTSDGSFSTLATWTANGATTNPSTATMTFALPQINKLGNYSAVNTLVRFGTVTDIGGEDDDVFRFTKNSTNVDIDSMSSNSEVKTNIGSLYSGKTTTWDFEGSLKYTLMAGSANESAQVVESGLVVDFTLEDIDPHDITELYEGGPIKMIYQPSIGPSETLNMGYDFNIYTRTITGFTPSKIDYVYYSGKGRKYGSYIDADDRGSGESGDNGYAENDLIENPVFIIEDIIRDELSLGSSNIDYETFDTAGNTTNGYLGDIFEDAVSDVKFAFAQYKFINSKDIFERLGRLCFSYIFISGDGKFKIKTLRATNDYSSSDQTIDFGDIELRNINKTSFGNVKNSILVKYNHDYGANQNKSEATATDSTSQGTTVNGFNQTMKLEIEANEILDSTTATKLAEALLALMKDRKNTIQFSCLRPKYNHLEIGDIIDFSNWSSTLKIYGAAMTGYFIVSDITKTVNGCSIKAIKVS